MIATLLFALAGFIALRSARRSTLRNAVALALLGAAAAFAVVAEGLEVGLATFALVAMLAAVGVALAAPLLPSPRALQLAALSAWLRNL